MLGGLRRHACRLWAEGTASRLDADRGRRRPRRAPGGHDLRDVPRSDALPVHAMRWRPRSAGTSCASMLMVPAITALKAGARIGNGLPFLPVCTHWRREVGNGFPLGWVGGASSEERHSSLRAHAAFRSRDRAPCTACASRAAPGRDRIRGVARSGQGSGAKALPASLPADVVLPSGRETRVPMHAFFSPSLTFRSRLVRHVSDVHAGVVLDSARRFPALRQRNGARLQGPERAMNALLPTGAIRMGHTEGVIPGGRSGEMIAGRWRRAHSVAGVSALRRNVLDGFIARSDRRVQARGLLRPYLPAMRSRGWSLMDQGACVFSAWRVECPPNATAVWRLHPLATRQGIRSTLHHRSAAHAASAVSNLPAGPHRSREGRLGRLEGGTVPSRPGRLTDVGQRDVIQSHDVGKTPVVQLSQTNHFHIVQQPGQDAAGLAEEIRRRLQVQSRSLMFDRMGA